MSLDLHPRPGIDCIAGGTVFLGLAVAGLIDNWAPRPALLLFVFGFGVVATALMLRGWSQLRREKAARPDLSWWQFLDVDPIVLAMTLAILLVWIPVFAAMSPEQHNNLLNSLLELVNLIHVAKGQP
jgi:hypothetical protein